MKYLLAAIVGTGLASAAGAQTPLSFREIGPTGLELSDHGKPVFIYNFGMVLAPGFPETMRRACYLHPVYAPDGTLLTDDFNPNHPHHRGISWMWPEVTVDGKKGDMWTLKGFQQRFVRWKARDTEGPQARLAVENGWFDGDRKFVKEDVEIVTHPAADGQRPLEFTLSFEAWIARSRSLARRRGRKALGVSPCALRRAMAGPPRPSSVPIRGFWRRTAFWPIIPGPKSPGSSRAKQPGPGLKTAQPIPDTPTAGCCGTASASSTFPIPV